MRRQEHQYPNHRHHPDWEPAAEVALGVAFSLPQLIKFTVGLPQLIKFTVGFSFMSSEHPLVFPVLLMRSHSAKLLAGLPIADSMLSTLLGDTAVA